METPRRRSLIKSLFILPTLLGAVFVGLVLFGQTAKAGASYTQTPLTAPTCSDGAASCGTHWQMIANLCNTHVSGELGCSGSVNVIEPAGNSKFRTGVTTNALPGRCYNRYTGQTIISTISGSSFGNYFGPVQAEVHTSGLPYKNDYASFTDSGCVGSDSNYGYGVMSTYYNLTICDAGYTATADGVCTKTCTISSFTCDVNATSATLAWSTSGCTSGSIDNGIGTITLPEGSKSGQYYNNTYTLTVGSPTNTRTITCSPKPVCVDGTTEYLVGATEYSATTPDVCRRSRVCLSAGHWGDWTAWPTSSTSCNDNNACTSGDHCDGAGACVGTVKNCNDSNACTTDSCNPTTGTCSNVVSVNCNDGNSCTTDSCNPATGTCSHTVVSGSHCSGNTCVANTSSVCAPSCSTNTDCGGCSTNADCNDGNSCTTDVCSSGTCTHTNTCKATISLVGPPYTFTAVKGGTTPSPQSLTIKNTGTATLNWKWDRVNASHTTSPVGTWCKLQTSTGVDVPLSTGGSIAAGSQVTYKVAVNAPSTAGTFTDCNIRIYDSAASNSPQYADITYTVTDPVASCVSLTFNPATSGFSANPVNVNEHFFAYCDYGKIVDSIWFDSTSGVSCSWSGNTHTGHNGFYGTAAEFDCTAPATAGSYAFVCGLHSGTPANTCPQSNSIGSITVNSTGGGGTANLVNSEKDIVAVNGTLLNPSLPNGTLNAGTDPLPSVVVQSLKVGDKITYSINLRNQGDGEAKLASIVDTLVNLKEPDGIGWQAAYYNYNGAKIANLTPTVSGTLYNQALTFDLSDPKFNIPAGEVRSLVFTAQLGVPSTYTGSTPRFQNTFKVNYLSNPNNPSSLTSKTFSTPLYFFSNGKGTPDIIEIP